MAQWNCHFSEVDFRGENFPRYFCVIACVITAFSPVIFAFDRTVGIQGGADGGRGAAG
jgi:hypothetical protein